MLQNNYFALVYITNRYAIFFPTEDFANHLMMAFLIATIATDEVHAQPVSVKHFCLNIRFIASLIIFVNMKPL
jgi:hypothetical protein